MHAKTTRKSFEWIAMTTASKMVKRDKEIAPPFDVVIPNQTSTAKQHGKLLRRPRLPKTLPALSAEVQHSVSLQGYDPSAHKMMEIYDDQGSIHCDSQEMDYQLDSPFMSHAPSMVSPPPPSESMPTRRTFRIHTYTSPESHVTSFISRDDTKYVLDPPFRGRSTAGSNIDGRRLTKPFKPKGPDGFPLREPKSLYRTFTWYEPDTDDMRYYQPPVFTLSSFIRHVAEMKHIPIRTIKQTMYSKHSYKRLTKLLTENVLHPRVQDSVNEITLTPEGQNIPACEPRIPQAQLLFEMAAMIKSHVRELVNREVKTVIKQMPKYSPSYKDDNAPHTEIILYEDDTMERQSIISKSKMDSELPATDAVFHSARTTYFQGSERSRSPFNVPDEGVISPSELAILDSLVGGGNALSLKAHFISELPDISPLIKTITYLNLSFNDFRLLPNEVLELEQLQILKLRNNPLVELPADINKLSKLRTLVVSFCLLSSLPLNLFDLEGLQHLDFSYNKITFLPNEILKLEKLFELNVEGNQLPALPGTATRLNLRSVNVKNNLMHPLFWKENTKNHPQRLMDLAALTIHKSVTDMSRLPQSVQLILESKDTCDCCGGALFGHGLRIIRPVSSIFGVKNLPFLFRSCSAECLFLFKNSTGSLARLLYGEDAIEGLKT